MLISLGFDSIVIATGSHTITLGRDDIEYRLGPCLLDLLQLQHRDCLYVINWPGSFTHIRLWCLVLNTLASLPHSTLKLFHIDKISFYRSFVRQGFLPPIAYLFIWQKRFCRRYDFTLDEKRLVALESLTLASDSFFCDPIQWWPDSVHSCFVTTGYDNGNIEVDFQWNRIVNSPDTIGFIPSDILRPEYMIEPNIH